MYKQNAWKSVNIVKKDSSEEYLSHETGRIGEQVL
ncbi:hypothetical protein BACCIP111895_01924 [Neobacillus rhizosphaerae]|uniref:Uncharacterized protein n=1 Tax=Neobacillus rhizosphaerae TaxID=2880965 RepID=A0ABM9EQ43_9BACI|nr:hypothetical protein BACCIP111895_01924 [Neobacillus rhizosphaerae]